MTLSPRPALGFSRQAFLSTRARCSALLLVLVACGAATAHAQGPALAAEGGSEPAVATDPEPGFALHGRFSFAGLLGIPTHERGELSWGFQLGVGLGWGKIPLLLGCDLGFSASGKERYRTGLEAFPELRVEVTRQDKIYFISAWLRLQPLRWPYVQPYLEGFAGTKLLQTEYSAAFVSGEGVTVQTEERDWTRSLGWGAGLDIPLSKAATMFVTLGLRRLYSHDAVFTETVRSAAGDTRATVRVPMDSWLVSLGLAGSF
jgi:hypothetical protein